MPGRENLTSRAVLNLTVLPEGEDVLSEEVVWPWQTVLQVKGPPVLTPGQSGSLGTHLKMGRSDLRK